MAARSFSRRSIFQSCVLPPDYSPERLETGTQNHEGIAGAAAAVDYLASLSNEGSRRERLTATFAELGRRQDELTEQLWNGLSAIDGVKLYGPKPGEPRTSTISFEVQGRSSQHIAQRLADDAIFASDGDFYALTVVERLGVNGLVRAGCACYTTEEEVERLISSLRSIVENP